MRKLWLVTGAFICVFCSPVFAATGSTDARALMLQNSPAALADALSDPLMVFARNENEDERDRARDDKDKCPVSPSKPCKDHDRDDRQGERGDKGKSGDKGDDNGSPNRRQARNR